MGDIDDGQAVLAAAEAKSAELQARLAQTLERAEDNRRKAKELAFAAEGQDDDAARRLSTKLIADAVKLDEEIEYRLQPAVDEAQRRVKTAKDAKAREAQRKNAASARVLAERLESIGAARDAAFDQARALGAEFNEVVSKLRLLGAPAPTRELIEANSTRALDAALTGLHPHARPVPPLQRHKFAELYGGWGRMTMNWATKFLVDQPASAEKPAEAA